MDDYYEMYKVELANDKDGNTFAYELLDDDTYMVMPSIIVSKKLTIPSTYKGKKISMVAHDYGYERPMGSDSLEELIISEGIEIIDTQVFFFYTALKNIKIASSVTTIGNSAFGYCTSLTSINIPSGTKYIKNDAFSRCSNLKSISLSNSLISIGNLAFSYCEKLEEITLPESLEEIGEYVFDFCDSLKRINYYGKKLKNKNYKFNTNLIN